MTDGIVAARSAGAGNDELARAATARFVLVTDDDMHNGCAGAAGITALRSSEDLTLVTEELQRVVRPADMARGLDVFTLDDPDLLLAEADAAGAAEREAAVGASWEPPRAAPLRGPDVSDGKGVRPLRPATRGRTGASRR